MLAECSLIRAARSLRCRTHHRPLRRAQLIVRGHASTSNHGGPYPAGGGPAGSYPARTNIAPLGSLVDELDAIAPRFEVRDGSIEILEGPAEFYEVLKTKILRAKRRIYLSTLYIGKTEHELISTIHTALRNNPDLKISFLIDALRGTRETPGATTASILAPLVSEFGPEKVQIRMFHTPNLTGFKKRLIPKRINEGWGLQHMKLYGIDDEIILSGANLSQDYFTNRLDRYHVFHSAELTEYYERIHEAISTISFNIQADTDQASGYSMAWPSTNPGPNPLEDSKGYIRHASKLLLPLIRRPGQTAQSDSTLSKSRTFIYPIFQLTPLLQPHNTDTATSTSQNPNYDNGQSTELPALTALLTHLRQEPFAPARTTFTAGYFNPSSPLVDLLLSAASVTSPTSSGRLDVIAASPLANGFYGSKGVSGMLPAAYTLLCRRFLEEAQRRGVAGSTPLGTQSPVRLREWQRGKVGEPGGWTYHAKGIWVTLPASGAEKERQEEPGPSVTLIGSSNYTQRSYTLDLEANALILTRDEALQRRLKEEEEWLGRDARVVQLEEYERTERRVGVGVRLAMWITRIVGGAL